MGKLAITVKVVIIYSIKKSDMSKRISNLIPKKKKTKTITALKKKLWKIVSDRIRARDNFICYTSGKKVDGAGAHCGHGLPSSVCGARLRYHPKNLHCQSYFENINAGGNGATYYRNQIRDYGDEAVDRLYSLQNKYIKADVIFYQKLIELYTTGTWQEIESYLEN